MARISKHRIVLISVIIVVALICIGVALFLLISQNNKQAASSTNNTSSISGLSTGAQNAQTQASSQVAAGEVTAAVTTLNTEATKSTSSTDKKLLYTQESSIYANAGNTAAAVAADKQVIAIDTGDWQSYDNLGNLYSMKGDKTDALIYLNKALVITQQNSAYSTFQSQVKADISQASSAS